MAVELTTMAAVEAMRGDLDRHLAGIEQDLARAWTVAWSEISDEWDAAARELIDIGEGDWPTRAQIRRSQRATNAVKAAAEAVTDLTRQAGVRSTSGLAGLVETMEDWQRRITATQLPGSGITLDWTRVDQLQLDAIVRRTTRHVESRMRALPAGIQSRMKTVLIRGVAIGENPNAVATEIVKRAQGEFDGGLRRARNIARTEILDAGRDAARRSQLRNRDVLSGWRWMCSLSRRTCPSCLAQHGSVHTLDEAGPHDHQQGRCTRVPIAKTWRELGIDLDEPADQFPDARAWFDSQTEETQVAVMGRQRLTALRSGRIGWGDLSQRVETPGWRDSYRVRPL